MMRREVFMDLRPHVHVAHWRESVEADRGGNALEAYSKQLFLSIAMYSRGDELEAVRAQVRAAVLTLEQDASSPKQPWDLSKPAQYYPAIWGLSLSILFGDPSTEFLQRGIGQDRFHDQLLRRTGALVHPVSQHLHPAPYDQLSVALEAGQDSLEAIQQYLRGWYAGMAGTPWFDTHLNQEPAFFGYWAFELAAVVKVLSITDSSFADNIFYPRDLVHQRLFRTWMDSPQGEADRSVKSLMDAQTEFARATEVISAFLNGQGSAESADGATETLASSLKDMGRLLGFATDTDQSDPEAIQKLMLQVYKLIAEASKNLAHKQPVSPEQERFFGVIREFEQELKAEDQELADALAQAQQQHGLQPSQEYLDRIAAIEAGLENSVKAEQETGEAFFAAMESMLQNLAAKLDLPKQPERDIKAEVAAEVSKRLEEANSKNMIGKDFDWSSIWRKE